MTCIAWPAILIDVEFSMHVINWESYIFPLLFNSNRLLQQICRFTVLVNIHNRNYIQTVYSTSEIYSKMWFLKLGNFDPFKFFIPPFFVTCLLLTWSATKTYARKFRGNCLEKYAFDMIFVFKNRNFPVFLLVLSAHMRKCWWCKNMRAIANIEKLSVCDAGLFCLFACFPCSR